MSHYCVNTICGVLLASCMLVVCHARWMQSCNWLSSGERAIRRRLVTMRLTSPPPQLHHLKRDCM
ncbi:hypothetical protein CLAFUW4_20039 [Fulvia fulva]|uniref:uncharacterized protein n=1 Tax=Passalora fulva TaxID=5499 RepID=UPI002852673D|nr:uncharacterized protein CLAFUR5_20039 [Fulvia fulva]KAK4626806.1 hypothetical protein CLAFUR4_20039 [Fulvia fulva]KAK4628536.1 hypothetical protein CLAFUR0_20039 [Fulvia fulva]WMI39025.1 hypothetical protein CLAFUR5_20039 [Fulvia fulva]WPV14001.1 hypothetical protein CLAFUW4_20039 [Fulvia fulva]WPV28524.1 hypothetical protein CLAFUW7_20039 [Fulvia fulva]